MQHTPSSNQLGSSSCDLLENKLSNNGLEKGGRTKQIPVLFLRDAAPLPGALPQLGIRAPLPSAAFLPKPMPGCGSPRRSRFPTPPAALGQAEPATAVPKMQTSCVHQGFQVEAGLGRGRTSPVQRAAQSHATWRRRRTQPHLRQHSQGWESNRQRKNCSACISPAGQAKDRARSCVGCCTLSFCIRFPLPMCRGVSTQLTNLAISPLSWMPPPHSSSLDGS